MGLQRFKLDVAAAVVNADNASLASLDTSGLLDLFAPPGAAAAGGPAGGGKGAEAAVAAAGGGKAVLEGLEELWDEAQYAEELSLDAFVSKLR